MIKIGERIRSIGPVLSEFQTSIFSLYDWQGKYTQHMDAITHERRVSLVCSISIGPFLSISFGWYEFIIMHEWHPMDDNTHLFKS